MSWRKDKVTSSNHSAWWIDIQLINRKSLCPRKNGGGGEDKHTLLINLKCPLYTNSGNLSARNFTLEE